MTATEFLQTLAALAGMTFVITSMLAMGLSLTIAQIIEPLKNARLVILETSNSNGLENRVAGNVLLAELERRGLSDRVELRFYNGKIHAKSTLIDSSMLIIGSQNMHYSSWGETGLTEYSLVTNAPEAIEEYQGLFETKWEDAIPFEEAEFGTTP